MGVLTFIIIYKLHSIRFSLKFHKLFTDGNSKKHVACTDVCVRVYVDVTLCLRSLSITVLQRLTMCLRSPLIRSLTNLKDRINARLKTIKYRDGFV